MGKPCSIQFLSLSHSTDGFLNRLLSSRCCFLATAALPMAIQMEYQIECRSTLRTVHFQDQGYVFVPKYLFLLLQRLPFDFSPSSQQHLLCRLKHPPSVPFQQCRPPSSSRTLLHMHPPRTLLTYCLDLTGSIRGWPLLNHYHRNPDRCQAHHHSPTSTPFRCQCSHQPQPLCLSLPSVSSLLERSH